MSAPVITVENLSKRYLVGHKTAEPERYRTLRDVIGRSAREYLRKAGDFVRGRQIVQGDEIEEFWALRDVSFELSEGEVLGIIGRNGAGKSTLLKVLSRITEPTHGRVALKGRVASLLEVGTGFHPELTGRENIFLNGAILGMTKAEIRARFDEIIDFADVTKFLDTPVKRYSSGMYVRLAFAIAANLESEILIIDEVLAVGDAEFQKRCFGKMKDVAGKGRTVLLVSHNMESIRRLCTRAILLESGRLTGDGNVDELIAKYIENAGNMSTAMRIEYPEKEKSQFHILRIEFLDRNGKIAKIVSTWDFVCVRVTFFSPIEVKKGSVVLQISTLSGVRAFLASTTPDQNYPMSFHAGINAIDCKIPRLCLNEGKYRIGAALAIPNVEILCDGSDFGIVDVSGRDIFDSNLIPTSERYLIPMECEWSLPAKN